MELEIRQRAEAGTTILELRGKLLMGSATESLRNLFHDLLQRGDLRFVFDLSELRYMDSAGIGEIVACHLHARERGGRACIVQRPAAPGGRRIVGLVPLPLERYATIEAALSSFA